LEIVEKEHESDGSGNTIEENDKEAAPELEIPKEKPPSDDGKLFAHIIRILFFLIEDDDELFQSARPSVQDVVSPPTTVPQSSAVPRVYSTILFIFSFHSFLFSIHSMKAFH